MSLKGEIPSVGIAIGLDKEKLQEWMRARQAGQSSGQSSGGRQAKRHGPGHRPERGKWVGKAHRDNHKARMKRGPEAFAKKADRRKPKFRCNLCGTECREEKLEAGLCPVCNGPK